ncbi:MAG TPA: hypothetical protein DCG69_12390 [Bacteroidales bacterium]|nr:hypothetical protein [Bacteroidales bacterium]
MRLLFLVLLFAIFSSCLKNEICVPLDIRVKANIYTIETVNQDQFLLTHKLDIDTLYAIGIAEKFIVLNESELSEFYLPLDNAHDQSSFVLNVGGLKDTIRIEYNKELLLNSIKCGVYYRYSITNLSYTTHLLKEIRILNPEIDVVSTENIQVVY